MFGIDRSIATKRNVPALRFCYNIENPVGKGQPNERRSVLLVQYMLDVFLSSHGEVLGMKGLPVSGEFGPETDRAIRACQQWLQMSPHAGAVPETGIVVPVRSSLVEGPRGAYVPTLLLLNRMWASIRPETFLDAGLLAHVLGEETAASLATRTVVPQSD
jgi:peptidoglycan hydrolase-like protein with peptidoglycan-binding domain